MKRRFTKHVRSVSILVFLFVTRVIPFRATATGIAYDVDWPAIHLAGTFTLDVGAGFGTYSSTSASGSYGGLNGMFDTDWTSVQFDSQPSYSELTFFWANGYTGYAVSPSYVGRSSPWMSADEALQDLLAKGAADGVYVAVVPEPTAAALVCFALLPLMAFRHRIRRSMS